MHRDIVVIGASAGGVECLTELCRGLPADFPAAILVVLHISPHSNSVLPAILTRSGALTARHPAGDEPIVPGQIYIAPPDHHLLVHENAVRVVRGPRENGHRPAVDPLFRTAARYFGPRVIGVVLSGALDDGTAGLMALKSRGGLAVVQDPQGAFHPSMPNHAIENVDVDYVVPMNLIAAKLVELVQKPLESPENEAAPVPEEMKIETDMASLEPAALHLDERPGTPSGFSCPECHGALFELQEGSYVRYRCRVGHAYSPDSLLADQSQSLEAALWIALRALEESSALAHRVAQRAHSRSQPIPAQRFTERAAEAERNAALIRQVLLGNKDLLSDTQPPGVDAGDGHNGAVDT
jgi:two-component system chemotaxis response regulator CheB